MEADQWPRIRSVGQEEEEEEAESSEEEDETSSGDEEEGEVLCPILTDLTGYPAANRFQTLGPGPARVIL